MKATLLIELRAEELPPKSLNMLGEKFADMVIGALKELGFADPTAIAEAFATPRRLAVRIPQILDCQPAQEITRRGPSVTAGLDAEGQPTKALRGFVRSCGAEIDQLAQIHDGNQMCFAFQHVKPGEQLAVHLADVVGKALKKLPAAKFMRWGDGDMQFIRPVHGLIMLYGNQVVPGIVLGLTSGNRTHGHRFLGDGQITLAHADDYETQLFDAGYVVASFRKRRAEIVRQLQQAAAGAQLADGGTLDALLDEVTALVEYPVVYAGRFSEDFLSVPHDCLMLSMKQHQKYFALLDADGRLLPRFLVVSNLKTACPEAIIHGNERVLRARLSDAAFFFDQDKKIPLGDQVPRLADVVYHNQLGSQLDRVARLRKLASAIAEQLGVDVAYADRAAQLCKADLLTGMVGEFPALQGIMGRYYALAGGEDDAVATAIADHYRPRFAGDALPCSNVGASVALADKLDSLVGIYGIGMVPCGDKDPFGLRRHALGVLRILSELRLPLDLMQLLQMARSNFPVDVVAGSVVVDVHHFMLERLKNHLREQGFAADEIDAVVTSKLTRVDRVSPRLTAVREFRQLPEAIALTSANKRIQNLLKKAGAPVADPDPALMEAAAEKALFEATNRIAPQVASLVDNQDYTEALFRLAGLRQQVDDFFDQVLVMADEPPLRANRLGLLRRLGEVMNRVADISRLAV